jgi:hypothetical protein
MRVWTRGFIHEFLEYIYRFKEEKCRHTRPAVMKNTDTREKTMHIIADL